jgi:hypothetical protein
MRQISVLLIGDLYRPEFEGVREFLASFGPIRLFFDAETALNVLAKDEIVPDHTIIVQTFPGEFPQQVVDQLREAAPLSRMITLLGSWCEGEMRSGQPWPTVIRSYWHQGLSMIGREIRRLAEDDCPSWGLPLTATDEERLLADSPPRSTSLQPAATDDKNVLRGGLIGIVAHRFESFDWLSAAYRQRGYSTLWLRGPKYPRAEGFLTILIDGTDFQGAEFDAFRKIAASYPQTRRIALMDFPRIEDRRRLLQAGAAAVVSKPLCVEDLLDLGMRF